MLSAPGREILHNHVPATKTRDLSSMTGTSQELGYAGFWKRTENNGHGVVSGGTDLQAGIYERVKQDLDRVPVF